MPLRPRPRPPPRRPAVVCVALSAALAISLALPPAAPAAAAEKEAGAFIRFVAAWRAGSAKAVAAGMDGRGTARFTLFCYPLSGKPRSMKPAQAKASLKSYFKRVSAIRLKDITARKTPANVRLYEYTYKPAGENTRTTHLQVQFKRDRKRQWVLASVTESP